jgi:hypothetical protein
MYERTQVLVDGFASLILYTDHLSHCLACLNDRDCKKRLELLLSCSETLKPLRQRLPVEFHQIIETLSGLKFSQTIQRDSLEKYDSATYNSTEPEPTGPHPA